MASFEYDDQRQGTSEHLPNPGQYLPLPDVCDEVIRQLGTNRSTGTDRRLDAVWDDDVRHLRLKLTKLSTPHIDSYYLDVATIFNFEPHLRFSYLGTTERVELHDANWQPTKAPRKQRQKELQNIFREHILSAPVEIESRHSRQAIDQAIGELTCVYALNNPHVTKQLDRFLAQPPGRESALATLRARLALLDHGSLTLEQTKQALQIARSLPKKA